MGGSFWETIKKCANFVKENFPKDTFKSVTNTGVDVIGPEKDLTKSADNAAINTAYDGKINSADEKDILSNRINTVVNKGSVFKKGSA